MRNEFIWLVKVQQFAKAAQKSYTKTGGAKVNSNSSKTESKGLSSSPSTQVTNQNSQSKPITTVCSLLGPKRRSKQQQGFPTGTHISQSIIRWLSVQPARGRLVAKQPLDPGQPQGYGTRLLPCHSTGSQSLPNVSTATQSISSPAGGKKHQSTEEEEKNIPPVCSEDRKNIGCGTYILRLPLGLQRVLLICDEWSRQLPRFKELGSSLLFPSQDVWGDERVKWRLKWSNRSVGAVCSGLNTRISGIALFILSISILC